MFVAHQAKLNSLINFDDLDFLDKDVVQKKKKKNKKKRKQIHSEDETEQKPTLLVAETLNLLPVATVYEKLNFPLKFDREQFVFDFSTCYSSDPENGGLKTRNSSSATSTI